MQEVSQEWKDMQNELITPESYVEVKLSITDPDALSDATASDSGSIYISNTKKITYKDVPAVVPYATLEPNRWVLDGSLKTIPTSDYGYCGYIGNTMSNPDIEVDYDDGNGYEYSELPRIYMDFGIVWYQSVPGVTITWDESSGEYAEIFEVRVYNDGKQIAYKEVYGNKSTTSFVKLNIEKYDRIQIIVWKWCLPHRRARISKIALGFEKVYDKGQLISFEHLQEADPLSASLPKAEISFSVDNTEGLYDPNNPDSLAKYIIERQEVTARYGFKIGDNIEWLDCGTFYISEWDAPQNGMVANFKARDLLEFLTTPYEKGAESTENVSLYDLAVDVLEDAELPLNGGEVRWSIDESLKSCYTKRALPTDTHAVCLQLIANAGGCVLYQDRQGVLRIEPLSHVETDYNIDHFNSFSKSELSLTKPVKEVRVASWRIEQEVNDEGSCVDVWKKSYAGYECGDIGEIVKMENELCNISLRDLVSDNAVWYLSNRQTLSSEWRADPRMDVLDIVHNENDYGTNKVLITRVKYSYNGTFKGSCEGRVI